MVDVRQAAQEQVAGPLRSEKVEEYSNLTCNICLEEFKDPKILPCCHTFCSACLQSIVSSTTAPGSESVTKDLDSITCPQCGSKHDIPPAGVASLPFDFTVVEKIETRDWCTKVKNMSTCGLCEQSRETVSFCFECEAFLCSYCTDAHKKIKTFSRHKVVGKSETEGYKPRTKPIYCQHHQENQVHFFCMDCKQLICDVCVVKQVDRPSLQAPNPQTGTGLPSHRQHTLYTLDTESATSIREQVRDLTKRVEVKKDGLEEKLQALSEVNAARGEQSESLKKELKEFVDKYIKELKEVLKSGLNRIDQQYSTDIGTDQREIASLKSQLAVLNSGLCFASKSMECSENVHAIIMMSQAMSRLRTAEVSDETNCPQHVSNPMLRYLLYVPPVGPLVFNSLQIPQGFLHQFNFNDVKIEALSHITVGAKAQVSVSFTVQPVGQPEFRIVYGSSNLPSSCVADPSTGRWTLSFTPCCIGRHNVQVKIFGQWMKWRETSFNVAGNLYLGAIVCRTANCRSKPADLVKEGDPGDLSMYEIGKLTKVGATSLSKSMGGGTSYQVEVTWGYESESPKVENLPFTQSEYSTCPLELVIVTIKGPQQSITLGVKTQLSVSISVQPVGQPEFQIVYGSSSFKRNLPVSCKPHDTDTNTWTLTFTPCYIGRHQIEVKIFGQWMKSKSHLSSPSFHVEGKLKEGDIVRRTPDWKSTPASLLNEGETEDTSIYEIGKLTKVETIYSIMGKRKTYSHQVEVTWGHESKNPKTENLSFTSGYPLELAITEDK